ncbi:MAG: hypothetical protein J7496_04380 [Novosphingobium sp.]|nr:hypothetical protein [Novosphingobium sp.]
MDLSQFATEAPGHRHDGWSAERKIGFLDHLSVRGNVRAACAAVGMSHEAAYRLRRREPLFARGWNAALALARENATDVLTCRALDGVAEDIWYRGEQVGTRIRYDTRLLLAHLARLDRLVAQEPVARDAGRFDEVLALIAGEPAPEGLDGEEVLEFGRGTFVTEAEESAWDACREQAGEELDEEGMRALEETSAQAAEDWMLEAAARWDDWFERAFRRVDAVLARTPSTVSTSGGPVVRSRHAELVSESVGPDVPRCGLDSNSAADTAGPSPTGANREIDPETSSG